MALKHSTTPTHHHPIHKRRPLATIGVGVGIFLAFAALTLSRRTIIPTAVAPDPKAVPFPEPAKPNTTSWVRYTDTQYPLSFKYPKNWNVNNQTAGSDYVLTIAPQDGSKQKMTIFISSQGYLGFEGLKEEPATIDGKEGVKIDNSLAGLQHKGLYYTFDAGLNSATEPTFQELLKTVMLR